MIFADVRQAREQMLDQVFGARTLVEIAEARQCLRDWLRLHPDEPGMADAFEALSHFEDYTTQQTQAYHQATDTGQQT